MTFNTILANASTFDFDSSTYIGADNFSITLVNLVQTTLAAVRIDIGNPWPLNNFILNTSVINATIAQLPQDLLFILGDNPNTVSLGQSLMQAVRPSYTPPSADTSRCAVFTVDYLCQTTRAKSPGSAFISVLVATLSMFTTGWGVLMLIVRFLSTRNRSDANYCDGCNANVPSGSVYTLVPKTDHDDVFQPENSEG
jgi:hypothetical protein